MKKYLIEPFKTLSLFQKRNFLLFVASYVLMLSTYPMTRSIADSLFLSSRKATETPYMWVISVVLLVVTLSLMDRLQKFIRVQKLYVGYAILTAVIFASYSKIIAPLSQYSSYLIASWKEVYIVVLFQLLMAYANALLSLKQIKSIYGPLGALGGLGGIIGGITTSLITKEWGTSTALYIASFLLVLPIFFFGLTQKLETQKEEKEKLSPLESIKGITPYVFLIGAIIGLAQFCINIADFQFRVLFTKVVTNPDLKTEYLGYLHSTVSAITLLIQIAIIPYIMNKVSSKKLLLFIPGLYLIINFLGLGLGGSILLVVAGSFSLYKSIDYSLFNVTKELLYHPLEVTQKYGAKYICDMFIYRFSKSLISIFLIFIHSALVLNLMMLVFLSVWIVAVFYLFKLQHKLFDSKQPASVDD